MDSNLGPGEGLGPAATAGLLTDPDPVGFACDQVIVSACTGRDNRTVVVAWGANAGRPRVWPRAHQVLELLHRHQVPCRVLGVTAEGHPAHPLRLAKDAPLRPGPGAARSRREPPEASPSAARRAPAHSRQAPRPGRVPPPDQ